MKFSFGRSVPHARSRAAFTLIELLTVMAIILVLAGLIISIAGSAQYNAAKSRATSEIKGMETGLESYKTDNGVYPSDSANANGGSMPTTEKLDAQDIADYKDPSTYVNASEFLYQALAGYQVNGGTATFTKKYMDFTPAQLHVAGNATGSSTVASSSSPYMYIMDPFGFSYGYSTIYAVTQAANNASSPPVTTPITTGYNPTFDLWSTGGYATGGKSTPSPLPTGYSNAAAYYNAIWIKNW